MLGRETCVIRVHDAWSRFCRELIVISASCAPTTLSGTLIPKAPNIRTKGDVIPAILRNKHYKYEPRWGDPTDCLRAARVVGVRNYPSLLTALSASPSPIDDIRRVRNFIAHRNHQTAQEVKIIAVSLGLPERADVDIIMSHTRPPGIKLFEEWITDLRVIAELCIQ